MTEVYAYNFKLDGWRAYRRPLIGHQTFSPITGYHSKRTAAENEAKQYWKDTVRNAKSKR